MYCGGMLAVRVRSSIGLGFFLFGVTDLPYLGCGSKKDKLEATMARYTVTIRMTAPMARFLPKLHLCLGAMANILCWVRFEAVRRESKAICTEPELVIHNQKASSSARLKKNAGHTTAKQTL